MQGKLITFEGGEGGGKSTQIDLLCQSFDKSGINYIKTREPGGSTGAEQIRKLLVEGDTSRWSPLTETLLHLAARKDHLEKTITPALKNGQYVICDRFIDSTTAYQGYGHGLGVDKINILQKQVIGDLEPDATIILDVEIELGISRANSRMGKENRYEKMATQFHKQVRDGFLEIAKNNPQRCHLINAHNSIEHIHSDIITTINKKFDISLDLSSKSS